MPTQREKILEEKKATRLRTRNRKVELAPNFERYACPKSNSITNVQRPDIDKVIEPTFT